MLGIKFNNSNFQLKFLTNSMSLWYDRSALPLVAAGKLIFFWVELGSVYSLWLAHKQPIFCQGKQRTANMKRGSLNPVSEVNARKSYLFLVIFLLIVNISRYFAKLYFAAIPPHFCCCLLKRDTQESWCGFFVAFSGEVKSRCTAILAGR